MTVVDAPGRPSGASASPVLPAAPDPTGATGFSAEPRELTSLPGIDFGPGGPVEPAPRGGLLRPAFILPVVVALLGAAIASVVVSGRSSSGPGPGEAIVTVEGVARVVRVDGAVEEVTDEVRLGPGDRLTMEEGRAEMRLADDVRFEARAGSGRVDDTEVEMAEVPLLRSGALLVAAPHGTSLRSGPAELAMAQGSVARVTRTLAVRVGAYRGRVTLGTAGVEQRVASLRSGEVVGPGELGTTKPMQFSDADSWDRRYLSAAISLDRELDQLVTGLEADGVDGDELVAQVRRKVDSRPTAARLTRLIGGRDDRIDAAVGLAVVGTAERGSFDERWARAFRFHDAGATWGLAALDLRADPDAVIDAIAAAVEVTPGAGGAGTGGAGSGPGSGVSGSTDGTGVTGTDGTGTEGPDGSTPGATVPGGGSVPTVPGGGTVPVPPVTIPPVGTPTPPVTVPTLPTTPTLPPTITGPVTTIAGTVGGITGPIVGPVVGGGGILAPIVGPLAPVTGGGILAPVTGSGGLLPLGG
jgi:hypothetical protein